MATYWLGAGGNDGNDGTSYANRKATWAAALALITSKGDVLNVVGTVEMDNTPYTMDGDVLTSLPGTSFLDPAFTIRGTDSDGQPAQATALATAANYKIAQIQDGIFYVIVEGIYFDCTAARSTSLYPIRLSGTGNQPFKFRYCYFKGKEDEGSIYSPYFPDASDQYSVANQPGTAITDEVLAEYCVFDHARMKGAGHRVHADHCLYIWYSDDLSGPPPLVWNTNNTANQAPLAVATNCTYDIRNNYPSSGVGRCFDLILDYFSDACITRSDTLTEHSNLICVDMTALANSGQLWNGGMINVSVGNITGTFDHSEMGYNWFVFGTNVSSVVAADPGGTIGFYEEHYHPDQPTTVNNSTKLYATDVRLDGTGIASLINSTSAWTWTDINDSGYSLTLPKDYRLVNTTAMTGALDGGPVGAVEDAVNQAPVVVNPSTYTATAGVLKSVSAASGLLAGATDADGDTLTATVVTLPDHGILLLNTTDGSFDFTPNFTYVGTDTFEFAADDGTTRSNTGTATINIGNNTPVGQDKSYALVENTQVNFNSGIGLLRNATDADPGHTVSVTAMGTPIYGTLVSYNITTGSFVYRPNSFFSGIDTWTFRLTDGVTRTDPYTVTMRVIASGGTPAATYVDTAPFYRPTLEVRTEFRIKSTKNRRKHHDVANYTESRVWNESTHRVINVGVSTTVQVNLGGVAEAQYLMVETDNDIDVSINDTGRYWSVSKCAAVALGSIDTVYLKNNSAANIAQVKLCVAD